MDYTSFLIKKKRKKKGPNQWITIKNQGYLSDKTKKKHDERRKKCGKKKEKTNRVEKQTVQKFKEKVVFTDNNKLKHCVCFSSKLF